MLNRSASLFLAAVLFAATATADTSVPAAPSLIVAIPAPPGSRPGALCGDPDRTALTQALLDRCADEKDPVLRRGCRHLRRTLRDCRQALFVDDDATYLQIYDTRRPDHFWYASWIRVTGHWSVDVLGYMEDCYED